MLNNKLFFLFFLLIYLSINIFPQLKLRISTDKSSYNYGDVIHIYCNVENTADTSITIVSGDYNSCQAEFSFNDYISADWEKCLPLVQQLIFPPHGEKTYTWTIYPKKFGLPNRNGKQTLIGYFLGGLKDTVYINAPIFNGGELWVGYDSNNIYWVDKLKDSLKVKVIDSLRFNNLNIIDENWELNGSPIDSLFKKFKNDTLFNSVQYNRNIAYDSIYITEVKQITLKPEQFKLYNAYPNPFNPSTTIKYEIPKESNVTLKIFDTLGREVATILNAEKKAGQHEVEWNAKDYASGIYFYQIRAGKFVSTKKMLLIK